VTTTSRLVIVVGIYIAVATVGVSCNSDPPWECTVSNEGLQFRQSNQVETDQLEAEVAQVGDLYRPSSGCVPGDTFEEQP
jgi:hypothetical protein